MPTVGIKLGLEQRRPMEQALIELQERYKRAPTKTLARMIAQLEAEIAERAEKQSRRYEPPSALRCGCFYLRPATSVAMVPPQETSGARNE